MIHQLVSKPRLRRRPSRDQFQQSPLLVFYEVTQACDLVCQHCRACAQASSDPAELSTDESLRLIDQLADFPDPPMLVLTGGDPLKRADIFRLIEHATSWDLDVSITPSATPLVTPQAIRRLADAGISRMAISIDGANAATHDATRGVAGSFDRSLRILTEARAAGIPLQVNTTLTPANVGQVERMADLFAQHEIVMWSVFFLVPVGRAGRMPRLSADGCEQAFAALWQQSQRQPYAIKTTEAPHYRRYAILHQLTQPGARPTGYVPLGVNDGKGVMFVGHTGIVHPSGFLPIVCGLFPLQHLVQIYQQSPVFRALRDAERLEGKCHDCEFRQICGGSRARAYAVTDNLFAQEPDCSYVPQTKSPASGPIMTRQKPASVQQLIDEHGHLHRSLERIGQALADRQVTREVIVTTFGELMRQVLNHFEHEEEGGYFADAVQASPRLGQRASDLLREHAEMAAQLAFLQQCAARDSVNESWWATIEEEFADFFRDFTAHEAAEDALLQDAYSDDIGTGD